MKALAPPLLAIWLLAFHNLCFAQAPAGGKEQEVTSSEGVSPLRAESADAIAQENNEVPPLSPAEQAFQRASEHAQNNELKEAIADCTEAIRLDPENTEYLIKRAEFYRDSENLEKGLEDVGKILEADPNHLQARLLRGRMLEFSGNLDKALTEFNTAVERNPSSVQALQERSRYFQRQGQRDMAMADADRIIQLQPDSPTAYLARAEVHIAFGEADHAMNYSPWLFLQNPASAENWEAYATRAAARDLKGDFIEASEDFDKAVQLSPDNAILLSMRGGFYCDTGAYEKGLADMERAVELQPLDHTSIAALVDLLATCPDERIRNGQKATEYAARALKLAPDDPYVWRACAAAAAESGNFQEAIKWQQRVIASTALPSLQKWDSQERLEAYKADKPYRDKLFERKVGMMVNEAGEENDKGHFDRAIALLSDVIAVDPKNTDARVERGFAYNNLEKYSLAIADFSVAIEGNPKRAAAYFLRAHSFYKTRQYAKAIDDFKMLEPLSTDKFDPFNDLAWIFATCPDDRFRDGGEAAGYIDRALEGRPNDWAVWDTCAAVFAENDEFDDAIEWEQACLDRTDIPESQRRGCEKRLQLYQQHRPYRGEPETSSAEQAASATATEPGK